jgi:hypothetical protein
MGEWSARRRDLYLTMHNAQNKQPCTGGIRTHHFSRGAAADPCLGPRGHWDLQLGVGTTPICADRIITATFSYLLSCRIENWPCGGLTLLFIFH